MQRQGMNAINAISSEGVKKVLVVDDNEEVVFLLKRILKKRGFCVMEALSARECLDKIAVDCPDLLLLDYMMPEMNGAEVCRRIRSGSARNLPIVVVSAKAEAQNICLAAGCDAFVHKPVIIDKLIQSINAAMQKRACSN